MTGTEVAPGQLIHYSASELAFDPGRCYAQVDDDAMVYGKPDGFWVSVPGADDWPSWCRGEEFRAHTFAHAAEVTLTADANVLLLGSPAALDDFTERFGGPSQLLGRAIRWGVVARQYDGIVIAPYQWSRRHSLNWYYGWDCASGCIWNLNAVAGVRDVTAEAVPA